MKRQVRTVEEVMELLPHRYPMLLIDRVLEITENTEVVALKNVSINEDYFNGHFPGYPVMPGVLIVEAMAQAAGIFALCSSPEIDPKDFLVYFLSIEDAKFRRPVVPGDQLYLHITKLQSRGNVWKMRGEAKVDGKKVAEAIFSAMIVSKK